MLGSFRSDQHTDDTSGLGGDSGLKDSLTKAVLIGLVTPALLLGIAICNLSLRRVYWPADRDTSLELVQTFDAFWIVAGTVMLKVGAAGVLFAWYWMANIERLERFCLGVGFSSIALAIAGLIIACVGFLV